MATWDTDRRLVVLGCCREALESPAVAWSELVARAVAAGGRARPPVSAGEVLRMFGELLAQVHARREAAV